MLVFHSQDVNWCLISPTVNDVNAVIAVAISIVAAILVGICLIIIGVMLIVVIKLWMKVNKLGKPLKYMTHLYVIYCTYNYINNIIILCIVLS